MSRDLRDPQKLGEAIQTLRTDKRRVIKLSVLVDHNPSRTDVPDYSGNPSCIDKYGRPADVQPRWQEIQVA